MLANSRLTYRWSWPSALAVLFAAALLPAGITFGQAPAAKTPEDAKSADKPLETDLLIELEAALTKPDLAGDVFVAQLEKPSADAALTDPESSGKWPSKAGALHTLETGKQYSITMQNGQEIVGEVAHQNDNWKVIRLSGSDETITINVNHIQYFRAARGGKELSKQWVYAGQPGGPNLIKVAIDESGTATINGNPAHDDKMIMELLTAEAQKREAPAALAIAATAGVHKQHVDRMMQLAAKSGLKIASMSLVQSAPADDKPHPKSEDKDAGWAAADFDGDGQFDLRDPKALYLQEMAQAKQALAERAAALDKLKAQAVESHAVEYDAIKKEFDAHQAAMVEKLQQELAQTTEKLKAAEQLIAELRARAAEKQSEQ
jgi:hypothetical protein